MQKPYFEHPDKVVATSGWFEHVMAIALDPRTHYKDGVIRCIKSREGDVATAGYVDRSVLHKVYAVAGAGGTGAAGGPGESLEHFSIGDELKIKNQDEIVRALSHGHFDFLGLEDPDIWIDPATGLMHLYFTMPFHDTRHHQYFIHLGHAVGPTLDDLEMTMPVLADRGLGGAKEVSIAPLNRQGFRYNLFESSDAGVEFTYSTVRVAIAEKMGAPWKFGETVFHPAENNIPWIAGHASPGPLFPKSFIDVGTGKLLGVINGREASEKVGDKIKYGMFSVGLFIYDYENGKIDWISPKPFIRDSAAKTITFASQFVEQGAGKGILFAHVDDSFVRAYTLTVEKIKLLLPAA
jgi:hypothetical protein